MENIDIFLDKRGVFVMGDIFSFSLGMMWDKRMSYWFLWIKMKRKGTKEKRKKRMDREFEEEIFKKIKEYMRIYDVAHIHRESYDFFIHHRLSKIVEEEPILKVQMNENEYYKVLFGQIFVDRPYVIDENREIRYITPNEARLREITYSSPVSVNIRTSRIIRQEDGSEIETDMREYFKVIIARIPMMIGTTKCNLYGKTKKERMDLGESELDEGGYFIVKGKERVLVFQERMNYNTVYVFEQKKTNKNTWIAEIRSLSEETGHSVFVQMRIVEHQNKVVLILPYISQPIPLGYIFYMYGFTEEEWKRIMKWNIGEEKMETPIVRKIIENIKMEYEKFSSKEECMEYMCKYSIHLTPSTANRDSNKNTSYVYQILYTEIFPHLGIESLRGIRGMFLGHMLSKIIMTMLGKREYDDKDHINNKRLETSGYLIGELFRTLYKRFFRSLEPLLLKRCDILVVISKLNIITQGIQHCFLTGNWGFPKSSYIRTGVSQILNRLSYTATLSHLRRIVIPIGKEGKNTKIRQVHPSQIGFICPHETPEGHCLVGETLVQCGDGYWRQIKEIKEGNVIGFDLKERKEIKTKTNYTRETVQYEIYTITTGNGMRKMECTGYHQILVWDNEKRRMEWKYANELEEEKDRIGISLTRRPIYWGGKENELQKYRILGLLYGVYQREEKVYMDKSSIERDIRSFLKEGEEYEWKDVLKITERGRETCHDELAKIWKKSIQGEEAKYREFLSTFFRSQGWDIWNETSIIRTIRNRSEWEEELTRMRYIHRWMNELEIGKWEMIQKKHEQCIELMVIFRNVREKIKTVDYLGIGYDNQLEKQIIWECFHIFDKEMEREGDVSFCRIKEIKVEKREKKIQVYDIGVDHEDHNFTANGIVVHNSAGIVKNMTNAVQYTPRIDSRYIRMLIEDIEEVHCSFESLLKKEITQGEDPYKILVNGKWIGVVEREVEDVMRRLEEWKEKRIIHKSVSISMNQREKEILIYSDEGRIIRPVFRANRIPCLEEFRKKGIEEWIQDGVILYCDSYEMEDKYIAMYPFEVTKNHDYCELHPSLLSGLCVSTIPYVEHTQAPRITYHASMGKQAIGNYIENYRDRVDTISHVLSSLESPLIRNHYDEIYSCDKMASGTNVIVAIAMYTGFNQEDSVIMNKSSVERGLFRSFLFRVIIVEEKKKSNHISEMICVPPVEIRVPSFNYDKLDEHGIIKVGMYVGSGDVIVGKMVTSMIKKADDNVKDSSVTVKSGEEGFVDRVYKTVSVDGYKIIKIKIRTWKIPEIGDKVASRSAQKGTIGMMFAQEDMPFTASGIVPDLIINPLCIPSRMTINQLIECLCAKVSVSTGKFCYSTPFSSHSQDCIEEITRKLESSGFERHGLEAMYNGFTGEMFSSLIFIGPTYYHRLKHLVSSKLHARNNGNFQALTRQPLEGRSRDGGLRFGEMERDCMISHGVSRFLTERLFDMSDKFTIPICSSCGVIPHNDNECYSCHKRMIRRMPFPYACKLLFQELGAMGIKILMYPNEH